VYTRVYTNEVNAMHTIIQNEPLRPRALTIDDFVKAYRVSRTSAYKLIGTGKLRSVVVSGRRLISVDSAEELLSGTSSMVTPPATA
jgi:hypothetical protein